MLCSHTLRYLILTQLCTVVTVIFLHFKVEKTGHRVMAKPVSVGLVRDQDPELKVGFAPTCAEENKQSEKDSGRMAEGGRSGRRLEPQKPKKKPYLLGGKVGQFRGAT